VTLTVPGVSHHAHQTPTNLNKAVVFATPSNRDVPMRGISYFEKPRGEKRFFARWREDGRKKARGFATPGERAKFARSLAAAREKIGKQALSFNAEEWVNYLRCKDVVGAVDLLTVCREWLAFRRGEDGGGMSCDDALKRYLRACAGDEPRILYRKKLNLGRWNEGARLVALRDVSPDSVRAWLEKLEKRHGFSAVTVFHHRKMLSAFFRWCVRERLCERNPCEAVAAPKIRIEEVSVLPVADAQRLFAVNAREPVAARMALEAFGGLRCSHAGRIERGEIDLKRRGIILAADKHKSRRRGYLEGLPKNLWAWLRAAPAATWEMTPCQYMHKKSAAFRRAGIVNAGNVLRHSFGSYYLALHDDSAKTAVKMQHTSPVMLYRHYKGVASKKDARAWFAIVPELKVKRVRPRAPLSPGG